MYALCTLIIIAILALLIMVNVAGSVGERRQKRGVGKVGAKK